MVSFGSIKVPPSALIFLSVVILMLIILLVSLMILNKVLCFANCKMPSAYFIDNPEKLLTDSESDDSDEEIYNNYAHIEKVAEEDKLRSSIRSISKKDSTRLSTRSNNDKDDLVGVEFAPEKDKLRSSMRSNKDNLDELDENRSVNSKQDAIMMLKDGKKHGIVAVARIHLFLDTLSSKLKIQVLQIFDLIGTENRLETKKAISIGGKIPVFSYQMHCSILPEKKLRFKTKIRQGDDPLFNETFYVPKVNLENYRSLSIRFRIYASQTSTLNVIGQCTCDLGTLDLSVDTEYNLTMNEPEEDDKNSLDQISIYGSEIHSISSNNIEGHDNIPELMLGLTLNSNTGRLTVEIIRGTCFSKDKNKDFYVKLSLFSISGQELSHTKTSVRKNTSNPVFRESFMFQVALFQMKEVTLMVSVFIKKSIHRKEMVGWLALGYKSSGEEELNHWIEVSSGIKSEVIRSHRLHQNSNFKKFLQ